VTSSWFFLSTLVCCCSTDVCHSTLRILLYCGSCAIQSEV